VYFLIYCFPLKKSTGLQIPTIEADIASDSVTISLHVNSVNASAFSCGRQHKVFPKSPGGKNAGEIPDDKRASNYQIWNNQEKKNPIIGISGLRLAAVRFYKAQPILAGRLPAELI